MSARAAFILAIAIATAACAPRPPPRVPEGSFAAVMSRDDRGVNRVELRDVIARSRATVVTFFSSSCACQRAHDARLVALYDKYAKLGVAVVAVDSNADASLERDRLEARDRGYPFPLLADPAGAIADALGAETATYSVVIDDKGGVRYRGGFDSDWSSLSPNPKAYVANAIERVLAGEEPETVEAKSLGCSLRRR